MLLQKIRQGLGVVRVL